MAKYQISEHAARSAIKFSNETGIELLKNINRMDNEVNSLFTGLQDPTINKYLALSENLNKSLIIVNETLNNISEYCNEVIAWMDMYRKM